VTYFSLTDEVEFCSEDIEWIVEMWARSGHLLLLALLFFFLLFVLSPKARAANRSVDVGVILHMSSWIGNISWSCMPMALDDFYAKHPNYTTRLNLHLRDSGNSSFGAAEAGIFQTSKTQFIHHPCHELFCLIDYFASNK